jgi:hypothetical protein
VLEFLIELIFTDQGFSGCDTRRSMPTWRLAGRTRKTWEDRKNFLMLEVDNHGLRVKESACCSALLSIMSFTNTHTTIPQQFYSSGNQYNFYQPINCAFFSISDIVKLCALTFVIDSRIA